MLRLEDLKHKLLYHSDTGQFVWINPPVHKPQMIGTIAGHTEKSGYHRIKICGKHYPAHRLAWFYMHGIWPPNDKEIDHKNRVRNDNRIDNLRLVTKTQNKINSGMQKNNTSGFKGVSFNNRDGYWQVGFKRNKKQVCKGGFNSPEEAHQYYKNAIEHYGEYVGVIK